MTCDEAMAKVQPFIDDQLSLKETEQFLAHIHSCKACYDELEVCYMVIMASRGLESDNVETYNLGKLLEEKLEETGKRVWILELLRSMKICSTLAALLLTLATAVWFLWGR